MLEQKLRNVPVECTRFFFEPTSPTPLGTLRLLLAAVLLAQAYFLSGDLFELYGQTGVLQNALNSYLVSPDLPTLNSATRYFATWGIGEKQVILATGIAYVASLLFLLGGLFTRGAAVAAWFLHWVLMNSGYCTNYGADSFAHLFLFYLIWIPAGHALSLDRAFGRVDDKPTAAARFSLRILQLHLCIVYFASGVEKSVGAQWWNGDAIWRSLMLPVYAQYDMSWMARFPWLAKALGWGTLVIETFYPFFIWSYRTRPIWVALTLSLHIGIIVFLGLGVFGALMSILTLSLFGVPMIAAFRSSSSFHSRRISGTTFARA